MGSPLLLWWRMKQDMCKRIPPNDVIGVGFFSLIKQQKQFKITKKVSPFITVLIDYSSAALDIPV